MSGGQVLQLLILAGAVLVVLGASLITVPFGVLALGVLMLLAAVDLRR